MVVTHTQAKDQGQGSVSSKDNAETDRGDCITSHANAVTKHYLITSIMQNALRQNCCCRMYFNLKMHQNSFFRLALSESDRVAYSVPKISS